MKPESSLGKLRCCAYFCCVIQEAVGSIYVKEKCPKLIIIIDINCFRLPYLDHFIKQC